MWASIIAPDWVSFNISQFTHHPLKFCYSSQEGRGGSFNNCEVILSLIHLLRPPFFDRGDPNTR